MKTFYFNIQSKGGVGKSMLTYLQALKHEFNERIAFVDLDGRNQSTTRQLHFLTKQDLPRLFSVDIFNSQDKIDREKIFDVLQAFKEKAYDEIYIDFGGHESTQLLSLLSLDFTADDFKEFEKMLNAKFVFNVIISGATYYTTTLQYLKSLMDIVSSKFEIIVCLNEWSFQNFEYRIDEIQEFAKKSKGVVRKVVTFGNIHLDTNSGLVITENILNGRGIDGYTTYVSKKIIDKETKKV
ncbi:P-loop NTPase family protein [Arachidicoccus soli]|uniref:ParA family protein n=1 Tax=Arachidicoccus soli TaxID=2341117 RepID=A0A386HU77_9BACT|nr:hypothetical protein [Arachidicoccus soli]AYD49061.1 hypothetical protein D6B99_16420 [Arachidicoccus soli]